MYTQCAFNIQCWKQRRCETTNCVHNAKFSIGSKWPFACMWKSNSLMINFHRTEKKNKQNRENFWKWNYSFPMRWFILRSVGGHLQCTAEAAHSIWFGWANRISYNRADSHEEKHSNNNVSSVTIAHGSYFFQEYPSDLIPRKFHESQSSAYVITVTNCLECDNVIVDVHAKQYACKWIMNKKEATSIP